MENILSALGVKDINDYSTIIDKHAFENINIEYVRNLLEEYSMSHKNLRDTEESKFEHINLVLMFKFERVIDSIKLLDDVNMEGFRLEPMP